MSYSYIYIYILIVPVTSLWHRAWFLFQLLFIFNFWIICGFIWLSLDQPACPFRCKRQHHLVIWLFWWSFILFCWQYTAVLVLALYNIKTHYVFVAGNYKKIAALELLNNLNTELVTNIVKHFLPNHYLCLKIYGHPFKLKCARCLVRSAHCASA